MKLFRFYGEIVIPETGGEKDMPGDNGFIDPFEVPRQMYQSRRDIENGSGIDDMRFTVFTVPQTYFYFRRKVHIAGRVAAEKKQVLVDVM